MILKALLQTKSSLPSDLMRNSLHMAIKMITANMLVLIYRLLRKYVTEMDGLYISSLLNGLQKILSWKQALLTASGMVLL